MPALSPAAVYVLPPARLVVPVDVAYQVMVPDPDAESDAVWPSQNTAGIALTVFGTTEICTAVRLVLTFPLVQVTPAVNQMSDPIVPVITVGTEPLEKSVNGPTGENDEAYQVYWRPVTE